MQENPSNTTLELARMAEKWLTEVAGATLILRDRLSGLLSRTTPPAATEAVCAPEVGVQALPGRQVWVLCFPKTQERPGAASPETIAALQSYVHPATQEHPRVASPETIAALRAYIHEAITAGKQLHFVGRTRVAGFWADDLFRYACSLPGRVTESAEYSSLGDSVTIEKDCYWQYATAGEQWVIATHTGAGRGRVTHTRPLVPAQPLRPVWVLFVPTREEHPFTPPVPVMLKLLEFIEAGLKTAVLHLVLPATGDDWNLISQATTLTFADGLSNGRVVIHRGGAGPDQVTRDRELWYDFNNRRWKITAHRPGSVTDVGEETDMAR